MTEPEREEPVEGPEEDPMAAFGEDASGGPLEEPEGELAELVRAVAITLARETGLTLEAVIPLAPGVLPRTTSGKPQRVLTRRWAVHAVAALALAALVAAGTIALRMVR